MKEKATLAPGTFPPITEQQKRHDLILCDVIIKLNGLGTRVDSSKKWVHNFVRANLNSTSALS